jgi:hypothetical protein
MDKDCPTSIVRVAVAEHIKEFPYEVTLKEVWAFINEHLSKADNEKAVVLEDGDNQKVGEIMDSSLYFALWETPAKMKAYFNLIGFDQGGF